MPRIFCTATNGLVIQARNHEPVTLAGANGGNITEVDATFWEDWKAEHPGHFALENGLIHEIEDAPAETVEAPTPAPDATA